MLSYFQCRRAKASAQYKLCVMILEPRDFKRRSSLKSKISDATDSFLHNFIKQFRRFYATITIHTVGPIKLLFEHFILSIQANSILFYSILLLSFSPVIQCVSRVILFSVPYFFLLLCACFFFFHFYTKIDSFFSIICRFFSVLCAGMTISIVYYTLFCAGMTFFLLYTLLYSILILYAGMTFFYCILYFILFFFYVQE